MLEEPGDEACTCKSYDGDECGDLESRDAHCHGRALQARLLSTEHCWQHDERRDREEVFHDHPAHSDVPGSRVQVAIVGEHANQHDRAGHRDGAAKNDSRGPFVAVQPCRGHAEQRRHSGSQNRPRDRHASYGEQFTDVEV